MNPELDHQGLQALQGLQDLLADRVTKELGVLLVHLGIVTLHYVQVFLTMAKDIQVCYKWYCLNGLWRLSRYSMNLISKQLMLNIMIFFIAYFNIFLTLD